MTSFSGTSSPAFNNNLILQNSRGLPIFFRPEATIPEQNFTNNNNPIKTLFTLSNQNNLILSEVRDSIITLKKTIENQINSENKLLQNQINIETELLQNQINIEKEINTENTKTFNNEFEKINSNLDDIESDLENNTRVLNNIEGLDAIYTRLNDIENDIIYANNNDHNFREQFIINNVDGY